MPDLTFLVIVAVLISMASSHYHPLPSDDAHVDPHQGDMTQVITTFSIMAGIIAIAIFLACWIRARRCELQQSLTRLNVMHL